MIAMEPIYDYNQTLTSGPDYKMAFVSNPARWKAW